MNVLSYRCFQTKLITDQGEVEGFRSGVDTDSSGLVEISEQIEKRGIPSDQGVSQTQHT